MQSHPLALVCGRTSSPNDRNKRARALLLALWFFLGRLLGFRSTRHEHRSWSWAPPSVGALLCLLALAPPACAVTNWAGRASSPMPPPRSDMGMAYDSARGVTVLFGGDELNDTWEWDGVNWTLRNPATKPPGRANTSMVYDSARGVCVLFGGTNNGEGTYLNDTWEWNGNNWTRRNSSTVPPVRREASMSYDSARGVTVLFGGYQGIGQNFLNDTWEWDGVNWTLRNPATKPEGRSGASMVYDSARRLSVFFGGTRGADETWEYNGTNWVLRSPANRPSGRYDASTSFDSARGVMVLFGGQAGGLPEFDTWEYNGTNWTQINTETTLARRRSAGMCFDSARRVSVLFGGTNGASAFTAMYEYGSLPSITSFTPTSGPVGTQVRITGIDFTEVREVFFGDTPAPAFTVDSLTQITATVPVGATTGPVSVRNIFGVGRSADPFTITESPSLVVNTPSDSSTNTDGLTSLREAINFANSNPDASTITFDANVFGTAQTINVGAGLPPITQSLTLATPAIGLILTGTRTNGGALSVSGGTVVVSNLTFAAVSMLGVRNAAPGGNLTLTGCTFADGGVALATQAGTTTLRNCTIFGNDLALQANTNAILDSCTIAGNSRSLRLQAGTVTATNSIIAGNDNNIEVVGGTLTNGGNNILSGTAAAAGLQVGGGGQPVLANNGGATRTIALALIANSPALDRGATTLAVDQRGVARPQVNGDDIGAFELQNTAPTLSEVTVTPANPRTTDTLAANVTASDPENNALTTTYVWRKNGTIIDGETGPTLDLSKPGNGDKGDRISVTATVSDAQLASGPVTSAAVTIVNTPPTPPNITIDQATATTNDTLTYTVTGVGSDADGDPITVSYHWEKNGTVLVGEMGTSLDLSKPGNGDKGDTISIVVDVSDGTESSSRRASRIIANIPPEIASVTVTPSNPQVGDTLTAEVVATDDDGETLTYSYLWKRNGVELRSERNRTLSLNTARVGESYSVRVDAADSTISRRLESAPVTVVDAPVNNAPTAATDSATVAEDSGSTTIDVLANDSFAPDTGETLTVTAVTQPTNGTVILAGGVVSYKPSANFNGPDSFTYTISDGNGGTDTGTVNVTVTSVNDAPTATNDSATVAEDSGATVINVLANDSFVPDTGETLTVASVTQPAHGSVTLVGGVVSYKPAANYNGSDSFTYTLSDGKGGTATATVNITVSAVNDAPVLAVSITPDTPNTDSVLSVSLDTVSDADGDSISLSYQWKKNGVNIVGATNATLDLSVAGNGDKGDTITVVVTGSDGTTSTSVESSPVTIGTSVPVVTGVAITPRAPLTTSVLTANVVASDADNDKLSYTYVWKKNGTLIPGESGPTLPSSQTEDGDSITVTVTANDGTSDSEPVTSAPVTIGNLSPTIVLVTPQGATDAVGTKRTFALTVNDANGVGDIKETWLLINDRLNYGEGATFIYVPSASSPTNGLLYLRRGDAFLPPIQIGTGSGSSAVLDNGAVRVMGSEVTVTVSGNSLTLNIPATIREGLIGQNTLFARVVDRSEALDPTASAGDMGFVRSGSYTVTSQFGGANVPPVLSKLSPGATYTSLTGSGIAPGAQRFVFYVNDDNGISDIESVWFLAGKQINWANSATLIYQPRTRRLFLRSDDGSTFLGGGQIGQPGIIENSQVRIDLSKITVNLYPDGKSFGITLLLQAKAGLLGQNTIWLRAQDQAGAIPSNSNPQGYVPSGTWSVVQGKTPSKPSAPSNGNS